MIPLVIGIGGVGAVLVLSVADRPDIRDAAPIFAGLIAMAALAVVAPGIARIVCRRPSIVFSPDGFRLYALLSDNEPVRHDRITEIRRTCRRLASEVIAFKAAAGGSRGWARVRHRGFAASDPEFLHALLPRLWKHSQ